MQKVNNGARPTIWHSMILFIWLSFFGSIFAQAISDEGGKEDARWSGFLPLQECQISDILLKNKY